MRSNSVVLTGLLSVAIWLASSLAFAQTLRIYHVDVEQADATLFVSPSGNTLLVDSGKNGHGARIKAVMQQAGVTRVDHFVATHYHEDHYGGIDDLVNDFEVAIGQAYDRGDKAFLSSTKTTQPTYQDYQNAVGNDAIHLTRGQKIPLDEKMVVTCKSSGGVVQDEEPPIPADRENDMSISLLVQYGGFRYFVGGDIESKTEGKIAARDLVMDVDVYQANHHGSHTSSSTDFMQDLIPSVIVISNGNNGRYEHPRQTTLDAYEALTPSPTVFQTNKYLKGGDGGNVPDEFIGDIESSETDGTILITVDLAGGEYVVSYRDQSRSFSIKGIVTPDLEVVEVVVEVVIESLLPNPVGSDRKFEEVTLRNVGNSPASMDSWILQDKSGRIWSLVGMGTIGTGQSATILRSGMPMSLNNSGDDISLIDQSNGLRDRFQYTSSQRGVRIETGH